jgi:hypothetical protein
MNASPIEKIVAAFGDCTRTGTSYQAHCPVHDDKNPSLSISVAEDGSVLLKCHAGCATKDVLAARGLKLRDLFPISDVDRTPRSPTKSKASPTPKGGRKAFATSTAAVADLNKQYGTPTAVWTYHDAQSQPVGVINRWDIDGQKRIRPVAKIGTEWIQCGMPTPRPLYRLPELLNSTGLVCIVEGEKTAEALASLGFTVTTSAHGANSANGTDWSYLAGREVVILPDRDDAGAKYASSVLDLLSALTPKPMIKIVELPDLPSHGDAVDFIQERRAGGSDDATIIKELQMLFAETATREGHVDDRKEITITTEEHLVNAAAVSCLADDDGIYQRGGMLVRIVRDLSPASKGIRRPLSPRIEPLPCPLLRERLAANGRWVTAQHTNDGDKIKPAHPPAWCVAAIHARGAWEGIRHLESVVDYPVLRPDGTILTQNGYDAKIGLLLESDCDFGELLASPSHEDAIAARDLLLETVADFPFEHSVHRAAWLAGLLTPLARFAFTGPAPLFLVDANVRAAGKGLLLDCISRIITGERFTVATYTQDEDELRKRITSLAMSGERLVLFDNLDGKFGNATLDAALTATSWEDRILGGNRMAKAPLYMTWYATGNNVMIAADTARRICHVRLESPCERPEERSGFHHPDLLGWIGANRAKLLAAALTLLRAYEVAGRPDMNLTAWGSFDGWSRVVRAALVWAGLPDPAETRIQLQDSADSAAESMGLLLTCWESLDPDRRGLTTSDLVGRLRGLDARSETEENLCAAIEGLVGKLDAKALGYKLRQFRRRLFQGRFIDRVGTRHQAVRWAVFGSGEFNGVKNAPHPPHAHPAGGGREDGEHVAPESPTDDWGQA